MKKVFGKIFASILAVLVLFSTLSFTVDQHFCGGFLVDSAVFTKANICGMEMSSATSAEASITKEPCCANKKLEVKGQDELQTCGSQDDLRVSELARRAQETK